MLDIRNQATLEIKKNERIYKFECACDAPLGEVFDALVVMKNYIVQRIQESEKEIPEEV